MLSHVDESGGLLILGKGYAGAHGQVIFGDRLTFHAERDPFRDFAGGQRDSEGCAWTDVVELISDGDTVHIPGRVPHAVRWGGVRLCVGYYTFE